MNLSIKPAEAIDIEPLFELNKLLIEQYEDLSSIDLAEILAWVRRKLTKKISEYRVVCLGGETVGYYRLCDGEDNMLEIDDLYVLAPYRRLGIGTEIVRRCIAESERLGKPLMLYVFTNNTPAVRLYEKMGFVLKKTISPTRSILVRPL